MENLVFEVGGVRLAQARFRSLSLAVPFNKLVKDLLIVPPNKNFLLELT